MDILNSIDPEVLIPAIGVFLSGLANLILLFLPVPSDNAGSFYKGIYTLINWVALNVGKTRNAALVREEAATPKKE